MGVRDAINSGLSGFSKIVQRGAGMRPRDITEADMEEQLKKSNPSAYNQMKKDQKRYDDDTKRRHTIKSKKQNITDPEHIKLRKNLGNQIQYVLDKNKELRKNGDGLKDDQIEELVELRDWVKDTSIPLSYENLNGIYLTTNNMARSIPELDQRVRGSLTNYEASEESKLKARDDTEVPLNIASDEGLLEKSGQQLDNMKNRIALEEAIQEKKIDDFNREVIESRADIVSTGYIDTNNKNRAELRPRIYWGNTDGQLMQTPDEYRREDRKIDMMLMWKNDSTEKPYKNDLLYQRHLEQERKRYAKTFAIPRDAFPVENYKPKTIMGRRSDYSNDYKLPESFLRMSSRKLIPVYPAPEEFKWHRDIQEIPQSFAKFEPAEDYSINKQKEERVMINRFPERTLQKASNANNNNGYIFRPMKASETSVKELFKY